MPARSDTSTARAIWSIGPPDGTCWRLSRSRSRHQYRLALDLAPGDRIQRLGDLTEAIDAVDMRLELALRRPCEELVHIGAMQLGLPLRMRAPEHALDSGALEQHQIER